MRALLLAAGEGRRLRPLTHLLPKPLIPVLDVPLIEYAFAALEKTQVSEVVVNAFHLAGTLERYFADTDHNIPIELVIEEQLLGTGGAVANVSAQLAGEPFIIANADILHGIDLAGAASVFEQKQPLALLLLRDRGWHEAGGFWVRDDESVGGYLAPGESPPSGARGGLFTGLHILSPEILKALPNERVFCIVQQVYRPLLEKGATIRAHFVSEAAWDDLGTPERYLDASTRLLSSLGEDSQLARRARRLLEARGYESTQPGIWTPRGWACAGAPDLNGPAFVGTETVIGGNTQIGPGAIIGTGARLDSDASLTHCIVWPGVHVRGHVWKDRIFYDGRKSLGV